MTIRRILDVVDASNGFMKAGSDLPVGENQEGAEEIIEPTNYFFSQIPTGFFDFALFKLDTHFGLEYELSPESGAFPNIHCEYDTYGWELSVNPSLIDQSITRFFMTKNTFDMWGSNPVSMDALLAHHKVQSFGDLPFKSDDEKRAYENLYKVTSDPRCLEKGIDRDQFLSGVGPETEVILIGVASNFCNADAIFGYLKRGAKVTVLSDLMKGIPLGAEGRAVLLEIEGIDRTEGGTIEEVLKTDRFAPYVASGQLKIETSHEFLARAKSTSPQPKSPKSGPA